MATKSNFTIDKGTDWSTVVAVTSANGAIFDVTGYACTCKFRKHWSSNNVYQIAADVSSGTEGEITLSCQTTNSSAIAYSPNYVPGRFSYDLDVVSDGKTTRVLQGTVTITPEMIY
jgi:hypothetical protein|tara:strand:+ start:3300 stop:3647 length:348 start_codon:yes stop_codon:yes gene_type:complete